MSPAQLALPEIPADFKRCKGPCREVKPLSEFHKEAGHQYGVRAWCKLCHNVKQIEHYRQNRDERLIRQKKYRARRRGAWLVSAAKDRARKFGLPFDLDQEDIQARVERGTCELTGWKFDLTPGSDNAPTLDQIVARGGYTKDNIRVIARRVNMQISKWGKEGLLQIADAIRQYDLST